MQQLTLLELEAGLEEIRSAPKDGGALAMIVRRPRSDEREVLSEAQLDPVQGLVGDSWGSRGNPHPEMQINIMNARAIALIAASRERWALAGDQLFLDLDLSGANLPAGTRLALGTAMIEVTAVPPTGCKKFLSRFGSDAKTFVNSAVGRELNLRGINAKVVQGGMVRVGDLARRVVHA